MINIIFEGYLEKESLYLKTMRKRWIILRNDQKLYSFKKPIPTDDTTTKPTEIIDLSKCKKATTSPSSFKFTLIFDKNNKRTFAGQSEEEVDIWLKYIEPIINKNQLNDSNQEQLPLSTGFLSYVLKHIFCVQGYIISYILYLSYVFIAFFSKSH